MGKKKAKNRAKKCSFPSSKRGSISTPVERPIRGISNIGNTCFLSSCLQALSAVLSFERITEQDLTCHEKGKSYACFLVTLQALQLSSTRSAFNPGMLLNEIGRHAPHFKNKRQHDSHELLVTLLSVLSDEIMENSSHQRDDDDSQDDITVRSDPCMNDPILSLFSAKCVSIITCLNCSSRFCSLQNCLDLSLHIPGSKHLMTAPRYSISTKERVNSGKKSKKGTKPHINDISALDTKDSISSSSCENNHATDNNGLEVEIAYVVEGLIERVCGEMQQLTAVPSESAHTESQDQSFDIIEPVDSGSHNASNKNGISIYDCLRDFTTTEELLESDGNGYICCKCSSGGPCCSDNAREYIKRDVTKRLLLVAEPNILVIHLKRLLPGGKYSKYVSFPLVLSVKQYVGLVKGDECEFKSPTVCEKVDVVNSIPSKESEEYEYQLCAVVVHLGGALGGHYIAYAKMDSVWYHTSDTSIRPVSEIEVLQSEAYMLFYKKILVRRSNPDLNEFNVDVATGEDALSIDTTAFTSCVTKSPSPTNNAGGYASITSKASPVVKNMEKVDPRWAKTLKPPELKKELQMRNLSIQGSKKELLLRLLEINC